MMDVIVKHRIYGAFRCYMYIIEWQKRSLPQAHLLVWLKEKMYPNRINDIILAELSNQELDLLLH